jgi:hypothetical protein
VKTIENSSVELRVREAAALARLLGVQLPAEAADDLVVRLLIDAARALAQRDWAVRVLDAWARERQARGYEVWDGGDGWEVIGRHMLSEEVEFIGKRAPTPDAARLAAAQAVYPTLPADVRAKLGECP